ncbi:MAG: EAL domain-containing protein [Dokdonella sp.]
MALWGSGDEFWDWDLRRQIVRCTNLHRQIGDISNEVEYMPVDLWRKHVVHRDDLAMVDQCLNDHLQGRTANYEVEHRLLTRDGRWIWVLGRGRIVERDANGRGLRVCGTMRDITESRVAERERLVAHTVLKSMGEAVTVTDLDFRFVSVNRAFTLMTGWEEAEIIGQPASILDCSQHPADFHPGIRKETRENGHWRGEVWQRRKNGSEFPCGLQLSEVRDAAGTRTHFVGVLSDNTDRKRTEQELRYLANYDVLTGLPNRTLLSERLTHAISRPYQLGRKVAVLFLDLDRFKHVNDSMGHAVGDRMLRVAGERLRHTVRGSDLVARIGGDEFTIVLDQIGDASEAERIAQKVLTAFATPLSLDDGHEIAITPSIGISLFPDHGDSAAILLKCADTAMYQAKDQGRNTWLMYADSMDTATKERAIIVDALRRALERNELKLVYQPRLSLETDRITGVEALLRWTSQELGMVSPALFIPLAEETGLIIEIGEWVLREACAQISRWRADGIRGLIMSINVSMLQLLRGDLTRRLSAILAEFDVPADQIELELTETVIMANAEQSITTLQELKEIGVSLAIDDFGTGYSSLSYLKRLPLDTLKIDKTFVGDITTDPDDKAITATVITMAHSLGLNVIAEGVETSAQIEYLRDQDCDEIQGYWLAVPLDPIACAEFLNERIARRQQILGT